uniref:Eukaryotic translation initiation factor 4E nuclear import factor 1 n=1 Tax=Takifugu rubripes TaxID=31033 RepID=A0A674MSA2_TAKRU
MENDTCVEEKSCDGPTAVDPVKQPVSTAPFRYTKEELLEIKELPISNERPECLCEKYDSDGVWDPEKWHASLYPTSERSSPVESFKKDFMDERVTLKRRIPDPRERLKEDDLDVILSPQRRSFGGGCQGTVTLAPHSRRPISPLENKENESLRLGAARRIGSGRIITSRVFERDARVDKERERERDLKDKRFRRDFGDKRVFSERRRNDSYAEEEPEWFSGGPTSQSETIELIGFDDKILEDDKRRSKRSRKKPESLKEAVEYNGQAGEQHGLRSSADQEVPHPDVLPEQSTGDFDFNEFFNLEKTMPGLASMIEDVLGEGPVSASRFSQWFSSTVSPSGSRSSSLRSTPHEELEKLAGLEPSCKSLHNGPASYFTPIRSEGREKVDILELLHKAKVDLKPLLSTLSVNKARLQESSESVRSLEEVEGEMKGMKLGSDPHVRKLPPSHRGDGTPFMAEHLEEALTGGSTVRTQLRDSDMSAFNKLVNSMKASGTLPTHPKINKNNVSIMAIMDLLGGSARSGSPTILGNLLGNAEGPRTSGSLHSLLHKAPSPPIFSQRAPSPDYFTQLPPSAGPQAGGRHSPANAVTSMLSPSFTPTSVIRKMYATKDKSRDESARSDTKEDASAYTQDENNSHNSYLEMMNGNSLQSGGVKASSQTLVNKEQKHLRSGSSGQPTPPTAPQGPSSSFPRPVYPVPLLSHIPVVRPSPQLHPNVVQRMLAQGIQPQQIAPALVQAGIFPPHVDVAQLQGLPPALLGQPLYPLGATGHPVLPPRANAHMQLALMQQHLQQQRPLHPNVPGPHSQNQGLHRTNSLQRHGSSPPPGLAKWFGSDVLEQPLPSMPAKVISVDELELRP